MKALLILTPIVLLVIGLVVILVRCRDDWDLVLMETWLLVVCILVLEVTLLLACVVITKVL
jgi:hypothetical protein